MTQSETLENVVGRHRQGSDAQSSNMARFSEKVQEVRTILQTDGLCPLSKVAGEVSYYFNSLGLDESYFELPASTIANHILCLYSAKTFSSLSHNAFGIDVRREEADSALFIVNSTATMSLEDQILPPSYEIERRIEHRYLGEGSSWEAKVAGRRTAAPSTAPTSTQFCVKCYRTYHFVSEDIKVYLWFFFVDKASFLHPGRPLATASFEEMFHKPAFALVANDRLAATCSSNLADKELFQRLLNEASQMLGPKIETIIDPKDSSKCRLLVCYREKSTEAYFSTITSLIKSHKGLLLTKKTLDPCHGFTIVDCVITGSNLEKMTKVLTAEASLLYAIPASNFSYLFHYGSLSAFEVTYCWAVQLFIFYFVEKQTVESEADYASLERRLDETGVSKLHNIIRSHELTSWSESRIQNVVVKNVDIIHELWQDFACHHSPGGDGDFDGDGIGDADQTSHEQRAAHIRAMISKLEDEFDQEVLTACLKFNSSVRHTNMWRASKSALSFELDPQCIASQKRRFPEKPYCIFLIIGSDFRGFHVRFSDIARGGVRLIVSKSEGEWTKNAAELFSENYQLALTQQKKNKDIPEGGSKGVILMNAKKSFKESMGPFARYIDALLDMLLPEPGRSSKVRPSDIVFVGPDENTADKMNWAAQYARLRGYSLWKAFTTGKSLQMGGIPHDKYGMTTQGVHAYVLGGLHNLGLEESKVTKCQTGGPDGDLGSNEIKISKDITIAIVDGSGVLYDPLGLNRTALLALAEARKTVNNFDTSLLSPNGFLVTIEQKNVTLPHGEVVDDGTKFRNNFHLHPLFTADVFVPCGGRPAAVNMSNIDKFQTIKSADGSVKPRFKLIVEGANLFFTQDARLVLEKLGVMLFKDSSANKGGVTSSSLEVLAALALTDDDHKRLMCAPPPVPPQHADDVTPSDFYQNYAIEVQKRIAMNAHLEFNCLWKESQRTHTATSILGDQVSLKINDLAASIRSSPLLYGRDTALRNLVLSSAIPKLLIDQVGGMETLLQRVPEAYCQWIFASFLASHYVYSYGLDTTEFTFMQFVTDLRNGKVHLE